MTFDPVMPGIVLAVAAATLLALRAVALLPAARAGRTSVARWAVTTVALLLLVLAAARPVTGSAAGEQNAQRPQEGANIYFLVDRSSDSAIPDFGDVPRIAAMRSDIEEVIRAHPDARFAIIGFAARPSIDWPLSADAWSLQPAVDALTPYPGIDSTEVNAAAAANVLRYQLISSGQQFPQAENLVYYLGSGAGESTVPQGVFDTPRIDDGAVLGYGTGPGEARLREIAAQLGLPYVPRRDGAELPSARAPESGTATATDPATAPQPTELYWVLTMLATALLLVEIYLTTRDLRRTRAVRRQAPS